MEGGVAKGEACEFSCRPILVGGAGDDSCEGVTVEKTIERVRVAAEVSDEVTCLGTDCWIRSPEEIR